jgi:hypothetical protein
VLGKRLEEDAAYQISLTLVLNQNIFGSKATQRAKRFNANPESWLRTIMYPHSDTISH